MSRVSHQHQSGILEILESSGVRKPTEAERRGQTRLLREFSGSPFTLIGSWQNL